MYLQIQQRQAAVFDPRVDEKGQNNADWKGSLPNKKTEYNRGPTPTQTKNPTWYHPFHTWDALGDKDMAGLSLSTHLELAIYEEK